MHKIVMITKKQDDLDGWKIIKDPDFSARTQAGGAAQMLGNDYNDYAEYANNGYVYRAVREQDLPKYGISMFDLAMADPKKTVALRPPVQHLGHLRNGD